MRLLRPCSQKGGSSFRFRRGPGVMELPRTRGINGMPREADDQALQASSLLAAPGLCRINSLQADNRESAREGSPQCRDSSWAHGRGDGRIRISPPRISVWDMTADGEVRHGRGAVPLQHYMGLSLSYGGLYGCSPCHGSSSPSEVVPINRRGPEVKASLQPLPHQLLDAISTNRLCRAFVSRAPRGCRVRVVALSARDL